MREIPDIAYNAAVYGGVLGAYTCEAGDAIAEPPSVRSSSASAGRAPARRSGLALTAIADQQAGGRVGDINKTLYKLGKGNAPGRTSTTSRSATTASRASASPASPRCRASTCATGWGSPIANALVPALAKPGNG